MPDSPIEVTTAARNKSRLADWATGYTVLMAGLLVRGIIDGVLKKLRILRKAGRYVGVDAFVFLVLYFTAKQDGGFKGLAEVSRPWSAELAAIAGRNQLITQQSLSRLFARVTMADVSTDFMSWLLIEATEGDELLQQPCTAVFDSRGGAPWRVFDLDGTLLALRRRGLPERRELPPAERLIDDSFGVEGYSGRKRAEIQMCRETLQDAGSGLWLGVWCSPGNGDKRESVTEAARVVTSIVGKNGSRGLIRMDGGYGAWWVFAACKSNGVEYLTRWNQYELLITDKVAELRQQSRWERVQDSGSGPVRYAIELGVLCSDDGQQSTRLVCCKYRDETETTGVGYALNGWRYELFATSLAQDSFSAAQIVTLFYGRVGQEARFAQEDRELRLDRIFSKNLAAQALASVVGLFVWNAQTVAGWDTLHTSSSGSEGSSGASDTLPPQPVRKVEVLSEAPECHPPNPLITLLETAVDWDQQLPPGWQWEPGHGLHCPAGNPMRLKRAFDTTLIFRAGPQMCPGCAHRADCSRSTQPRFRKELHVQVPADMAEQIRELKRRRLKASSVRPSEQHSFAQRTKRWSPPSDVQTGPLERSQALICFQACYATNSAVQPNSSK